MTDAMPPEDLDALILRYLDGQISRDDFARLSELLHDDPASLDRFVELSRLDRSIRDTLDHGHTLASVQEARLISESTGESFEDLLAHLAAGSEKAQTVVLQDPAQKRPSSMSKTDDESVSARELLSLAGYLASKGIRTKAGVIGSIAAVLMLGALLYLTIVGLGGNAEKTNVPKIAGDQPEPSAPSDLPEVQPTPIAAMLTGEHNAAWEHHPGKDLYAGQRLTLIRGTAEIATTRGAIVVIEAPASIELLNNSNAIHLDRGRLVGICHTESSKGFLVRTPDLDVTDLGTEFGVEVNRSGETSVEVFSGSVAVQQTDSRLSAAPVKLVKGQTASTRSGHLTVASGRVGQSGLSKLFVADTQRRWQTYHDRLRQDPSVLAYYSFEQPTEGLLPEARGNQVFHGQIHGAQWVEGRFPWKRGLRFGGPGTMDRVELSGPASDRMNFAGSFSIAVWFKAEPFTSDWQSIITKGEAHWRIARNTMWGLHPQHGKPYEPSALNFGFAYEGSRFPVDLPGKTPVDDGVWHQAVIVYEVGDTGRTKHLYIDGVADGKPARAQAVEPDDNVVWIGGNSQSPDGREFHGVIDEVAIFERALTPGQVSELYRQCAPPQQTGEASPDTNQ